MLKEDFPVKEQLNEIIDKFEVTPKNSFNLSEIFNNLGTFGSIIGLIYIIYDVYNKKNSVILFIIFGLLAIIIIIKQWISIKDKNKIISNLQNDVNINLKKAIKQLEKEESRINTFNKYGLSNIINRGEFIKNRVFFIKEAEYNISIVGISLQPTFSDARVRDVLISQLRKGIEVSIFLVSPKQAINEEIKNRIKYTYQEIKNIKKISGGNINLYLVNRSILSYILLVDKKVYVRTTLEWDKNEKLRVEALELVDTGFENNYYNIYKKYIDFLKKNITKVNV